MSEHPRALAAADAAQLVGLSRKANWNQTERDWERVIELEPEGCFGIEIGGRIVSTTTTICYGRELAWIGMVLTDPEFRGRGLARRLMRHALEYVFRAGIAWIKLDATDMGRPLYRSLGFEEENPIERWMRPPAESGEPRSAALGAFEMDEDLDRKAFGAGRRRLLERLASDGAVSLPGGFGMGRNGANAAYFGPCVARSAAEARTMLGWFLAPHSARTMYWDLLPANEDAVRLARESGFEVERRLVRMSLRGPAAAAPLDHDDGLVFAIAGFEFG